MMKPLELAEQLGEAILDSDEYKDFTKAKEAMDNSEAALDLVENFQGRQQALRESQMMGKKISQEQIDELREHQRKMLENPEINAYLEARKTVDGLLAAVNETISRVTGMETGHSHGGGGGGGCSGGCC
ncbi:MAG: YlbF family regulator [Bacillota bacterium]|nr:YlbF family regulator [Bacillota bacterium]MDW7683671.1 YlbF family regulator [Bacillota bacterium]